MQGEWRRIGIGVNSVIAICLADGGTFTFYFLPFNFPSNRYSYVEINVYLCVVKTAKGSIGVFVIRYSVRKKVSYNEYY